MEFASTASASKNCKKERNIEGIQIKNRSIIVIWTAIQIHQKLKSKLPFRTSLVEIELEDAKVETSSRVALEVALCSLTTFCIASK